MIEKFLKIILGIFAVFVVVNLLFLDFFWLRGKTVETQESEKLESETSEEISLSESTSCQPACLERIQEEVEKLAGNLPTSSQPVVEATPTPTAGRTPSVTYLPIGSSGSTSNGSWTDIAGTEFYFNLADYQKVKAARWEVNLRSFLAGNAVYARIYDVTNNRAVDGSELSTTSGTSVVLRSGDLVIWQGNNLYRVQARSPSENPAYLDTPRLKILLE